MKVLKNPFLDAALKKLILVSKILFFCLFIIASANAQTKKPNIIFVLGDDVGYSLLKCDGGNLYSTPNLDSLAKNGMRFTQCHSTPLCSPSRFELLTGKYNFRNYFKWGVMDTSQKTIANMFQDAGYKTACFGKWQLSGGDASIHKFGFDDYTVHDPFGNASSKYKNPFIYTHGNFLNDSLTFNKYGPDIIADSLFTFLDRNKDTNFFIYYPMILVHDAFEPTPKDSAFATWIPNKSDTVFFPDMVSYMDKQVGKLVNKLQSLHIAKNTVIIFSGDNGTPPFVSDYHSGDSIKLGEKGSTTEGGTHVPLIVYWPGTVAANTVNNDLIDFTDFFPTLAGIAKLPKPLSYGILDGVDFSQRLKGKPGTPRSWTFDYYNHFPDIPEDTVYRWAQTDEYKLYDTSAVYKNKTFFNIKNDPDEKNPIPKNALSSEEKKIKNQLSDVINGYVVQSFPLLSTPVVSVTDSSAIFYDTVLRNAGVTVTSAGEVWSTKPKTDTSSSFHTVDSSTRDLSILIKPLQSNTTYYAKAYAINYAGIAYSKEVTFKTLLHTPAATHATFIDTDKFTANWKGVNNTTHYSLDVSTSPNFSIVNREELKQSFNNGKQLPDGWSASYKVVENDSMYGNASPSVEFTYYNAQLVTKPLKGVATELKFFIQGLSTDSSGSFLIDGFNGSDWVNIQTIKKLPVKGIIKDYTANTTFNLPPDITQFRFTFKKYTGSVILDDIFIAYDKTDPSFIKRYKNIASSKTSKTVTGLNTQTTYFYRIKALNNNNSSVYSNVVSVNTSVAEKYNITRIRYNKNEMAYLSKKYFLLIQKYINPTP